MIKNGDREWHVGELVAKMATYRLYTCSPDGGPPCNLLQVAASTKHNGYLDRNAYTLRTLVEHADLLEGEYANVKTDPKDMLNYQLSFPKMVDSFISADQGDRRVNILAFRCVDDVRQMVPLSNILYKDNKCVDARTSVWILGKLLKLLVFAHDAGFSVGNLGTSNILIEPDKHYVVLFDWALARKIHDGVTSEIARAEIQSAAQSVVEVLGGSLDGGIPNDGATDHEPYLNHVMALAREGGRNAAAAHQAFYALVDSIWPRGFHPFTSLSIGR